MSIWVTADEHYNHANIIRYCHRPFADMKAMNYTLCKRFAAVVSPEDITYHIGDFAFYGGTFEQSSSGAIDMELLLSLLSGKHIFICGSHDRGEEAKSRIQEIILKAFGYKFRLVHDPEDAPNDGILNLTGHVHEAWLWGTNSVGARCYNVGVDVHNFAPVKLDTIAKLLRKGAGHVSHLNSDLDLINPISGVKRGCREPKASRSSSPSRLPTGDFQDTLSSDSNLSKKEGKIK